MKKPFDPEIITARDSDGKLQYSDAYGLTVAQLGSFLESLREVQPDAHLTDEDFISYYMLQFPMATDIVRDLIIERDSEYTLHKGRSIAEGYYTAIGEVLCQASLPALMARIAIRDTSRFTASEFTKNINGLVVPSHETDEHGIYMLGLRPANNAEMHYHESKPQFGNTVDHHLTVERGGEVKMLTVSTTDISERERRVDDVWVVD